MKCSGCRIAINRDYASAVCDECAEKLEKLCNYPTVTVPRDEWERMQAESEAWREVGVAWKEPNDPDESSATHMYWTRGIAAAIYRNVCRLARLSHPNATEGK